MVFWAKKPGIAEKTRPTDPGPARSVHDLSQIRTEILAFLTADMLHAKHNGSKRGRLKD